MNPTVRARTNPAPGRAGRIPTPSSYQPDLPRSGDVLLVDRRASVQFASPMRFRVIRVHDWPTYAGWIWLDGYQLDRTGEAVERRSIFVQRRGLRRAPVTAGRPRPGRRVTPREPVAPK